ncbi:uncharacterized protein LOC133714702 isoform X2 [Rosa rugosa]|uniref:uncharacterized protein LOC133714702 isoform X2 n=1 Tax=Rosa rugosa TaxID=74645 RepID=UPI002B40D575|nr:uncharacterized protein LOC133714702 isoform X2 [Rosa rugosa]
MAATPNSSTVSLKLLMDVKRQKVLFAEAGKDFVDFLFALLSLPIGTVIRLLSKGGMVGSFGKLYESIENLDNTYIQPTLNKDILLKPKAPVDGPNILKLANNVESSARKELYLCSHSNNYSKSHPYVTENPNEKCPSCSYPMNLRTTYVGQPTTTEATSGAGAAGYVKGVVTYMIMDDLEVKPMSTISSITMLNRFNIKDVGALEEKVVELGMDKGVKLLKESLRSKSVLTKVFLEKKAGIDISFSEDQLRRASAATNTTSISFGASSPSAATSNSAATIFGISPFASAPAPVQASNSFSLGDPDKSNIRIVRVNRRRVNRRM